jgi:hypothetical protein
VNPLTQGNHESTYIRVVSFDISAFFMDAAAGSIFFLTDAPKNGILNYNIAI